MLMSPLFKSVTSVLICGQDVSSNVYYSFLEFKLIVSGGGDNVNFAGNRE